MKRIQGILFATAGVMALSQARAADTFVEQVDTIARPPAHVARLINADHSINRAALDAEIKKLADKPWEIEGLLYALAEESPDAMLPILVERYHQVTRREDKMGMAIAIRMYGGKRAGEALAKLPKAADIDAAQWAELLSLEASGGKLPADTRQMTVDPKNTFQQVLPLQITLTVYAPMANGTVEKHVVSPQQLFRLYGQAHACTNTTDRDGRLVIAKHLDLAGQRHIEGFLFQGMTLHPNDKNVGFVNFLSRMSRDVYRSGQVRDMSMGRAVVTSEVQRTARWFSPDLPANVNRPAAYAKVNPIRLVGGTVSGWLYINPAQLLDDDDHDGNPLDTGEAQLSTRVSEDASVAANAFFTGRFFGKLSDLDGDGKLDVNTIKPYVDRNGFVDSDGDGHADAPLLSMSR